MSRCAMCRCDACWLPAVAASAAAPLAAHAALTRATPLAVALTRPQYGEPGPRPAASYLQGADGACLRIRNLWLRPQGTAGPSAGAPEAESAAEPPGASASSMLGSLLAGEAAAAGAAAPADAAAAEADEAPLGWRQTLLHIPALLWGGVVTNRRSSTRLGVSGVSLSLLTFPTTWRGYHPAAAAAAAAAVAPTPASFSFTPGRPAAAAATPNDRVSPNKRRRARVTVQPVPEPLDSAAQQRQQWPPTQPPPRPGSSVGGSAAGARLAQDVQQHQAGAAWQLDYWALLQAVPAEEHVLFKQWELSVMLCLLPPGHAAPTPAPAGGGGSARKLPARLATMARWEDRGSSSPSAGSTPRIGRRPSAAGPPPQQSPAAAAASARPAAPGTAAAAAPEGSAHLEHLPSAASTGADYHYDTDCEDESPLRSPSQRLDSGPAGAAPNGHAAPVDSPQLRLDRSSLMPEAATPVSPAERAAAFVGFDQDGSQQTGGRLAGVVARIADGGVPGASVELMDELHQTLEAEQAAQQADGVQPPAGAEQQHAAGAAAAAAAAAGATGGGGMLLLDVYVELKALIPELNAASMAILNRLADRQLHHSHFGQHWAARPQVPVCGHAHAWWQHGGEVLAAACGATIRREVPLAALEQRRQRRLEYQALYAASHTATPGFQEPGRRWWQRRRVQPAAADELQRLRALEAGLTAEEIAHFRWARALGQDSRACLPAPARPLCLMQNPPPAQVWRGGSAQRAPGELRAPAAVCC